MNCWKIAFRGGCIGARNAQAFRTGHICGKTPPGVTGESLRLPPGSSNRRRMRPWAGEVGLESDVVSVGPPPRRPSCTWAGKETSVDAGGLPDLRLSHTRGGGDEGSAEPPQGLHGDPSRQGTQRAGDAQRRGMRMHPSQSASSQALWARPTPPSVALPTRRRPANRSQRRAAEPAGQECVRMRTRRRPGPIGVPGLRAAGRPCKAAVRTSANYRSRVPGRRAARGASAVTGTDAGRRVQGRLFFR
jgi:hypothetical protein